MRHFIRSSIPDCTRILLIESGPREVIERVILHVRELFGEDVEIDLVTCYAGEPAGFRGLVYNVNDFGGGAGRDALLAKLAPRKYCATGVICAALPIMTKWKWWLAFKIPAKVFIINEGADYFWLDLGHTRQLRRFVTFRLGLTGAAAAPALLRLVFFPVIFIYLLLYAVTVHLRRKLRSS